MCTLLRHDRESDGLFWQSAACANVSESPPDLRLPRPYFYVAGEPRLNPNPSYQSMPDLSYVTNNQSPSDEEAWDVASLQTFGRITFLSLQTLVDKKEHSLLCGALYSPGSFCLPPSAGLVYTSKFSSYIRGLKLELTWTKLTLFPNLAARSIFLVIKCSMIRSAVTLPSERHLSPFLPDYINPTLTCAVDALQCRPAYQSRNRGPERKVSSASEHIRRGILFTGMPRP